MHTIQCSSIIDAFPSILSLVLSPFESKLLLHDMHHIIYHVHHQNRCYVATLIAIPIFFTLPTYRYRPSTILYTNNSHKILINCKIYESRMKYLSKEESSCDMSGVKLQSIKIVDYLLKILGHRSSFLLVALCSN